MKIIHWNPDSTGTIGDWLELLDRDPVAVTVHEWSDREHLTHAANTHGYKVITGDRPGQSATPVFVRKDVEIKRRIAVSMLPPRRLNAAAAGPSRNKWKWAMGGLLKYDGDIFGVVSTHLVPSHFLPLNHEAAEDHMSELLGTFSHRRFPWVVGSDTNDVPDSDIMRMTARRGWTNNHRVLGEKLTHGNRVIDYVMCEQGRFKFNEHRTIDNHSGHMALLCNLEVRE